MSKSIVLDVGSVLSDDLAPADEYDVAVDEARGGTILTEVAIFRLWRMREKDGWTDVMRKVGVSTWDELVRSFCDTTGVSRAKVYSRFKAYASMAYLGYSPEDAVRMMAQAPWKYTDALNRLVKWDLRDGRPRRLAMPKEDIKRTLENLDAYNDPSDVRKHVKVDVLGRPEVAVNLASDMSMIVVHVDMGDRLEEYVFHSDHGAVENADVVEAVRNRIRAKIVYAEDIYG